MAKKKLTCKQILDIPCNAKVLHDKHYMALLQFKNTDELKSTIKRHPYLPEEIHRVKGPYFFVTYEEDVLPLSTAKDRSDAMKQLKKYAKMAARDRDGGD